MDSINYTLAKFSRLNNLRQQDYPFAFGQRGNVTAQAQAASVVGYKKGAESYNGTTEVTFNRVDLGALFKNVIPEVTLFQPKDYGTIFRELLYKYGLPGATEDAVIAEVVNTPIAVDGVPTEVTLSVAEGNFYRGSVLVKVKAKIMPLDEIVAVRELDTLVNKYPLDISAVQLERKYYHYDFNFSPELANIRSWTVGMKFDTSSVPRQAFLRMINAADVKQECGDITWAHSTGGGTAYNLAGMTVQYNGLTTGWPEANQAYRNVCIFGTTFSRPGDKVGNFMIHYD